MNVNRVIKSIEENPDILKVGGYGLYRQIKYEIQNQYNRRVLFAKSKLKKRLIILRYTSFCEYINLK